MIYKSIDLTEMSSQQQIIAENVINFMSNKRGMKEVTMGTFNNSREAGMTFEAGEWTFSIYEHRNSDAICINGCRSTQVNSWGPYISDSKWEGLANFKATELPEALKSLASMIKLALTNKFDGSVVSIG